MPLPDFSEFVNYKLPKKKQFGSVTTDAFDPELLKPDAHNTQDNAPDERSFDVSGSMYSQPRTEEYLQHLKERPRHADYPTSTGRKVASGALKLLLGSDLGVGNPKFSRATQDWAESGSGMREGSQIEQKDIIQRRLRLADMLRQARGENSYRAKLLKIHTDSADRLRHIESIDIPELERKKLRDAEYAKVQEDVKKHRDEAFQESRYQGRARLDQGNRRLDIAQNRPVSPLDQKRIEQQTHMDVAKDPRFGPWYDSKSDSFGDIYELDANGNQVIRNGVPSVKEKMPEELKPMLKRAIAEARNRVAKRKRTDYDVMQWDDPGTVFSDEMPDFLKDENP